MRGVVLGLIVLGAAAVALVWVVHVPIYQAPDEPEHLDYAFCLCDHPYPFRARDLPPGERPGQYVHPYTRYLVERAFTQQVAARPGVKMPAEYGSRAYYDAIDRDAPPRDRLSISRPPSLLACYPFGYYAVLAGWMLLLRQVEDSLVFVFFGARALSVLLLAGSLVLSYATARELRNRRDLALILTAAIGFFPLTSFVSSYVQPDNLAFTLVSLCYYLALRLRHNPGNDSLLGFLGVGLGALLVTKVHVYLCVLTPILAMLATYRPTLRAAALLTLPSLVLGSVHLWSVWGAPNYFGQPEPCPEGWMLALPARLQRAVLDYYAGTTHDSFWGVFGWMDTPLVLGNQRRTMLIRAVIQVLAWVVLGLTLVRLERVASRLFLVTRRGRGRAALRIAFSNPVLNSYFLFTVLMIVLHVALVNRFAAQGRNWLPFLLPIFLGGILYAPKALTLRRARLITSHTLAVALLLYSVAGSYYAVKGIQKRYYPSRATLSWRNAPPRVR
jgi:hypothetical protein